MSDKPLTRLHHLTLASRDVIATREFFANTFRWKEIALRSCSDDCRSLLAPVKPS